MSSSFQQQVPLIVQLADRIEDDIRLKSLKPGDAYLGAADAARMLRVSTQAANRALQLLAQRNVLERKQRKGTFISRGTQNQPQVRCVHLLVHHDFMKTEGLLVDGTLIGIQGELPSAELQFNFLPLHEEIAYVDRLIAEALRSSAPEGFVLVRASVGVQRLIAASGLPAVVNGVLFPSISGLTSLDRNHYQVGQLLCQHLLAQGHRQIAVLMHDRALPGHHHTLDAVRDTLVAAGLGAGALTHRCLPSDEPTIAYEVATFCKSAKEPVGFICRSKPIADVAFATVAGLALPPRRRPTVTACDVYDKSSAQPPYAYARQILTPEQIGTHIGRLLVQQAAGRPSAHSHQTIPVALVEPSA